MLIRCPSCQTEYTLQLTSAGALCTCFRCNHEFYVDVHGTVAAPPPQAKKEPELEEEKPVTAPAEQAEQPEKNISLDEKIKSIDAKYKSFEDDLSWNDDNLLTIDDLGDDDIPDVEVPSSTPSLEEHLKDASQPKNTPVINKPPAVEPIVAQPTTPPASPPKKNRLLAWRRARKENKKNTKPAPEAIKKAKKTWSLPWKKSDKEKAKETPTVDPVIAAPKKKTHRIWPWIAFILVLLMAAGLWFKKETWIHQPAVRSALLKVGLSKTASNADWFIDHQSIQMRWQKNSEGKQVLIIEGRIDNTLAIPLPMPQFEASFGASKKRPILLHSTLTTHLNEAVNQHGNENPAWQDQTPVAELGHRLFILVLRDISPQGVQRVRVRAIAGESKH